MTAEPMGPVVIGPREIYDEVIKVKAAVAELATQRNTDRIQQQDHESRLRSLEKWRYAIPASIGVGAASLAAAILGFLARPPA